MHKFRYEETNKKLIECIKILQYDSDISETTSYLLQIIIEENGSNNTFIKYDKKIKNLGKKLLYIDKMMKVIITFQFFTQKYSYFYNIEQNILSLNIIWNGINGWNNEILI
jgi:hypothetical protein